jgi:hypothetical protein
VTALCNFWRANFHPIVLHRGSQGLFRRKPGNTLNRQCNWGLPTVALPRPARTWPSRRRRRRTRSARRGYLCSCFVLKLQRASWSWRANQAACKPGSVPAAAAPPRPRGMAIPLGRPSPDASRDLPGRPARKPACPRARGPSSLLGLAPGGVCRAIAVAGDAVRSYRTLSPSPAGTRWSGAPAGGLLSVALSLGSPPPGITRHRVSVEPGLSSPERAPEGASRERPSGHLIQVSMSPRRAPVSSLARRAHSRASSPSSRASVARSATPSTRCGRKWRWNAAITRAVAWSSRPCCGTG